MANRHTYSKIEIERYFDRICMPDSRRVYDVISLSDDEKLSFLDLLQKHHLVKVPWENLTQHYSWHRAIIINPKHLYRKIVDDPARTRGGYCMEVNYLYHFILYSLKFDVYMAGSRIYNHQAGKYGGWTHIINLVTIGGMRYLVDGGFGGQGPSAPLALDPGVECMQIRPAQMRVTYDNIPNNISRSQKVWIYQHRYNEASTWKPMYCFVDLEFTPEDVTSMNFAPSQSRYTFFTHKVVAHRFTTERELDSIEGPESPGKENLDGKIDGTLTINHDVLKWRRHGEKVVVWAFKTEDERVAALKRYFGIVLPDEDREAITNTMAMIGVKAMGVDD